MKTIFILGYLLVHSSGITVKGNLPFESKNDCLMVAQTLQNLKNNSQTKVDITVNKVCEESTNE